MSSQPNGTHGHRLRKGRVASVVLLIAGVAALVFMAPQFLLFVPLVLAVWLLARFGLVPRGVHADHESVRIAGTTSDGDLRAAEITITADAGRREVAFDLLARLVERLDRGAGACASDDPAWAAPVDASLARRLDALVGTNRCSLLFWPGPGRPLQSFATSAPGLPAPCRELLAGQPDREARAVAMIEAHDGRDLRLLVHLVGEAALLEPELAAHALELRDCRAAAAWTTGWVRHAERRATESAQKRRRAQRSA